MEVLAAVLAWQEDSAALFALNYAVYVLKNIAPFISFFCFLFQTHCQIDFKNSVRADTNLLSTKVPFKC
jgi:hypothetical protein